MDAPASAVDKGVPKGHVMSEDSQPRPLPTANGVATGSATSTTSVALATISERLRQTGLFDDRAVPFSRFTRPTLISAASAGAGLPSATAADRLVAVNRQAGSRPEVTATSANTANSVKPSAYFALQATPFVAAAASAAP